MKLYGFFRSSASFRVRIALNLKGIPYENEFVHLRKGEQFAGGYVALNPQAQVPTLVDGDTVLVQSPAIIEYLDEVRPEPPLLPRDPAERARVRAIAMAPGCDIHPVNNARVLKYLLDDLKVGEEAMRGWYNHWIGVGFNGIEGMLAGHPKTGKFCHGGSPTLADIFLVPQVVNARRFGYALAAHPTIERIFESCMAIDAFARAQPDRQPDAE